MFAARTYTSPGVAPGRRNSVVRGETEMMYPSRTLTQSPATGLRFNVVAY